MLIKTYLKCGLVMTCSNRVCLPGEGRSVVTARRDLNFGGQDSHTDPSSGPNPPATGSATATAATARQPAATAAHPPVRRSVSFSKEVLKPADGGVRSEAQHAVFDGSALPDGITAIPVADPDDPSLIVMQVTSHSPALPAVPAVPAFCNFKPFNSTAH